MSTENARGSTNTQHGPPKPNKAVIIDYYHSDPRLGRGTINYAPNTSTGHVVWGHRPNEGWIILNRYGTVQKRADGVLIYAPPTDVPMGRGIPPLGHRTFAIIAVVRGQGVVVIESSPPQLPTQRQNTQNSR